MAQSIMGTDAWSSKRWPTTPENAVPEQANAARGLAYRVPPTLCSPSDAVFFHWRAPAGGSHVDVS